MQAAVIGSGVAGSASAIALRQAGTDVTVYEAYEDPAGPVGSFVSLAVNGLRALDKLGCLAQVQQAGFPVDRQRMWSGRGTLLGDVPRGRRSTDALRSITLMRADLVGILREKANEAGAVIITGGRVQPAGVRADLVVGADGMWSATRRALDPAAAEPVYAGIYTVSGVSRRPDQAPADGFNWVFGRDGVFIYLPAPDGTIWWSAQIAAPDQPADPQVTGRFRTEPIPAAILDELIEVRARTVLHTLAPVTRRHDARTVLIGDAAHPAGAGQGASMALEDAVVLGRELAAGPSIPAALDRFDQVRHARAGKLATMEAKNRDAKIAGPVAARLREAIMPLVFSRFYEKATGWLYDDIL